MGILIGIFWIVYGIYFVSYKYLNENWGVPPGKTVKFLLIATGVFVLLGWLVTSFEKSSEEFKAVVACVLGIPFSIAFIWLLIWLIKGDVDSAVKNEYVSCEIFPTTDANQGLSVQEIKHRQAWFFTHDELLSPEDLKKENNLPVVGQTPRSINISKAETSVKAEPDDYLRFLGVLQHPDVQSLLNDFRESGNWLGENKHAFGLEAYRAFVQWAGHEIVEVLINTYSKQE